MSGEYRVSIDITPCLFIIYRIPFARAKTLATQFNILDALYPIFADDPVSFLYPSHFYQLHNGPVINPYQRGQSESSAEGKKDLFASFTLV